MQHCQKEGIEKEGIGIAVGKTHTLSSEPIGESRRVPNHKQFRSKHRHKPPPDPPDTRGFTASGSPCTNSHRRNSERYNWILASSNNEAT